jgi:hypothetical protein
MDGYASNTALWDLRLELSRDIDRATMDGSDDKTTAFVELHG